ncbi:MAG: hypothetical protein ACRDLL_17500 [Solirubrobacterales bacterium]
MATIEHGGDVDLWLHAPADDGMLSSVDRKLWPEESRQPQLWTFLDGPGRATICALALDCHLAEPGNLLAFGGRLLERIRQRKEHAAAAERERLHRLDVIVSTHLSSVPDLAHKIAARGNLLASLIKQRAEIGALIERLGGAS